jgi:hypothetical protein
MVRKARRIHGELTPDEQARVEETRALIKEELPLLIQRQRLAKAAEEEDTFSGELRRRIHRGGIPITQIAKRSGISLTELDEFLTAERTLPSSVIDQLVEILGCKLVAVEEVK